MAKQVIVEEKETDLKVDKKSLSAERKKLKEEQKLQKKEAKARAKEIAAAEAELDDETESGGVSSVLVTVVIIIAWLGILGLLIKLDVGSFGSGVLAPILKNIPVVNLILPNTAITESIDGEAYMGYTSLKDAVEQIKKLELELEKSQSSSGTYTNEITTLKAEIERLQTFETNQVNFDRIKTQFYEEVIYSENGPGLEAYKEYYESIDPTTAEYLYKQVVLQLEESQEIQDYASAYSDMKAKDAAAIFEEMTDNLDLAARILGVMDASKRGEILGAMDPVVAAKLTKIMDPDS